MVKVGIVGYGYVGKVVERAIAERYRVHTYDAADPKPRRALVDTCDIAFICVPTPAGEDGVCDTSAVDEVLSWIKCPLVVIRSTMPADYEAPSHVVYQPEFIGESSFAPWREETEVSLVVSAGEKAQAVLDFWKPILGPQVQYIATDWRTAAEIKYAVNCHGAVKAAWWQEYLGTCASADTVRNACMAIPWIEPYHTLPLGGVGGKCFPKDLSAFHATHHTPIAEAALRYCIDPQG